MARFYLCLIHFVFISFQLAAQPGDQALSQVKNGDRQYWAFQKWRRTQVPTTVRQNWVRNPIDSFVLAKLEERELLPSPPANKLSLLRRVTFDLTGLPPTLAEIENFEKDQSADAYERVVDRLLASPHFGERWAQHWLDVVRYAESNGYEVDGERPSAWRYRDYVVKSFNEDKPFDRFLTEQIAGDLLAAGVDARANSELWIATGFHRCGPIHLVSGNVDPEESRNEFVTELLTGIGSAFMGLTLNCARCHDHKFDPISQADYYRLSAYFASTQTKDVDFATPEERTTYQLQLLSVMAKIAPIKARVAAVDAPYQEKVRASKLTRLEPRYRDAVNTDIKNRTPEQQQLAKDAQALLKVTWDETIAAMPPADRERRAQLRAQQHALEAELPMPPAQAWAVAETGKSTPTRILIRGEVKKKGAVVEPAIPRVFAESQSKGETGPQSGLTRKDLAAWLTSRENPLTARVFVNRIWQHHFTRGLVATPNDFGARGAKPTHPELLDWLAAELVENGWKSKHLHRLIVLSATYQQSSRTDAAKESAVDPENKLLWKMNRRRLEGESIRDALLAAAGTLNRDLGGPMIRVPLEPEVYDLIFTEGEPDGLWPITADVKQHSRRSLYLFAKRNVRQPLLEAFDQPDRLTPCADRAVSTFAPQALILMNGPLAQAQSRALASRLLQSGGNDPDAWIGEAYQRCFARVPRTAERELAHTFLTEQAELIADRLRARMKVTIPDDLPDGVDVAVAAALADFCLALFNANEFIYVQ